MTSIFSGINTALSALLAQQQVQETTSHNVANANTPGYTRQEAVLSSGMPYTRAAFNSPAIALQMGMGVTVTSIRQFKLDFIDGRMRGETSAAAYSDQRQTILQQVEAALPETGTGGLNDKLSQFWTAWQNLTSDPASLAARSAVINTGASLATLIDDRYTSLNTIRQNEDQHITTMVADANTQAASIARLNLQIITAQGAGQTPNDLIDQRDQLITSLSEMTGATVNFNPNGDALVSIGGHIMVSGGQAQSLSTVADPNPPNSGFSKVVWSDGLDAQISSGRIGGSLAARNVDVPARMQALDTLAAGLITQVNAIHTTAYSLPPNAQTLPGQNFFNGTGAADIAANPALLADPSLLGAAATANAPGDSSKALAIAQLASQATMSGGTRTFNAFWSDAISQLGQDTKQVTADSENHGMVRDALNNQKESVGGVNLDEEAARLVESQRAYQAAARVLTAFDQMADTIINNMGVVGR